MAKSNQKQPQTSSGGLWETYEADIASPFSEHKKSSCENHVAGPKKKNKGKKDKPAPDLAAAMFASGVEKRRYDQPEPLSGPNAWSRRSGSALFNEPPSGTQRSRYSEPHYPPPQGEEDEEAMILRAIKESLRTEQEEKARKKQQDKDEEEWFSKVVKDLTKEDKSSGSVKMSEARKKVTQRYSGDSTDSDDFLLNNGGKSKSGVALGPMAKSAVQEQTQSSSKTTEKSKKKSETSQILSQTSCFRDGRDFKEKQDKSRGVKVFSSNLYDDYDDDGSELDEADCLPPRSTFWPKKNESHKWNAESWVGGRSEKAELSDSRKFNKHESKAQRQRTFKEELPDTRNYKLGVPQHNRDPRGNELTDPRCGTRTPSFREDFRKSGVRSKQSSTAGSPGRSRNFKQEFFSHQSEEIERELDENRKHVKFATDQSTYVTSNSEAETDSCEVFASNKSNFDVSLYSNQQQKSKGLPIPDRREVKASGTRNRGKPLIVGDPKSTVSKSGWKDCLQSSDEREKEMSGHGQSNGSKFSKQMNADKTYQAGGEGKKLNVRLETNTKQAILNCKKDKDSSSEKNDLGLSLSDMKLGELPSSVDKIRNELPTVKPTNIKTSVLDEIKAEVKLPQDNNIYNFYHNKQLGIQNTQEHLTPQLGFTETPASNFDAFMENLYNVRQTTSVPQSTVQSEEYCPFPTHTLPPTIHISGSSAFNGQTGQPYDYYPMQQSTVPLQQVPYYSMPQSVQSSYTASSLPSTSTRPTSTTFSDPTALRATSTPHLVAPSSDTPPIPLMTSSNPPDSSNDYSRQLWRQMLSLAENDPGMLSNLNTCLRQRLDSCSTREEMDTLLSFFMEVNATMERYSGRHQTSSESYKKPAGLDDLVSVETGTGRIRGKRSEPRDHVPSTPGNVYEHVHPDPTPANVYPNPPPANTYPNPTPGHFYLNAPRSAYSDPTPGHTYFNFTPETTHLNRTSGNAYSNPTPESSNPNHTPGNTYPNSTSANPYPTAMHTFSNPYLYGFSNIMPGLGLNSSLPGTFPNPPENFPFHTMPNLSVPELFQPPDALQKSKP